MSESYKAWWYLDGSNDVWPMEVVAEGLCIEELVIPVRYKKGVRVDERYVRGGLAEENAKLRELVDALCRCDDGTGCERCPLSDLVSEYGIDDYYLCEKDKRIRELGIEVEE